MRLLMVASDKMEFSGVLARASEVCGAALPLDWARTARFGGHETLLAANGVGWERASAAVDAALGVFRADAVVSVGYCGGLDPKLETASIVVATAVASEMGVEIAAPVTSAGPYAAGETHSSRRVVQTAEEKRELWAGGACAVEMEAAGVAQRARLNGLPFYCVKVVTDLAYETMHIDFNKALRPDGHFATIRVLGSILRSPLTRLPEAVRLRKRCALASDSLGEFLADCRF
jgi:adenosylhomocysteine nucleosidase